MSTIMLHALKWFLRYLILLKIWTFFKNLYSLSIKLNLFRITFFLRFQLYLRDSLNLASRSPRGNLEFTLLLFQSNIVVEFKWYLSSVLSSILHYFQAAASNFHSEGLKFIPKLPVDMNNSSFPGQWHRL